MNVCFITPSGCVIPVVCETNERDELYSNNTTTRSLERCILIMKLHVSACNGHHQVSTPIKKSLCICGVPFVRDIK